ncbi:hypothetical protein PF010_g3876 [Phytophthora fragariae]|uniref:Uncharacterized protein n=1 Tax=Phytophthora fragariae TaxID=53985 RepID=A0A6G0LSY0_9STRA|nr:hypothetical protein PF010_g3876 [Phytophthora fragariae]
MSPAIVRSPPDIAAAFAFVRVGIAPSADATTRSPPSLVDTPASVRVRVAALVVPARPPLRRAITSTSVRVGADTSVTSARPSSRRVGITRPPSRLTAFCTPRPPPSTLAQLRTRWFAGFRPSLFDVVALSVTLPCSALVLGASLVFAVAPTESSFIVSLIAPFTAISSTAPSFAAALAAIRDASSARRLAALVSGRAAAASSLHRTTRRGFFGATVTFVPDSATLVAIPLPPAPVSFTAVPSVPPDASFATTAAPSRRAASVLVTPVSGTAR